MYHSFITRTILTIGLVSSLSTATIAIPLVPATGTAICDSFSSICQTVNSNGHTNVDMGTGWPTFLFDGSGFLKTSVQSLPAITGTVGINNFPSDQVVHFTSPQHTIVDSGSMGINNFPSNQNVTLDGTPATGVSQDSGATGSLGWLSSIVKNIRLIVTAVQGTLTTNATLQTGANVVGFISNTVFAATQSGTWNIGSITTLPSIVLAAGQHIITDTGSVVNATLQASSAVIGHVIVDSGTVTSNVGTGTRPVSCATSATCPVKATTDQTTPGTTDLVHSKVCDTTTPTTCANVVTNGAGTVNSISVSIDNAPSVGTVTTVAMSASSVTILASNSARKSYTICNTGNHDLYISTQSTATATNLYADIPQQAGSTISCYKDTIPSYTGLITGIWSAAGSGNAIITSLQ